MTRERLGVLLSGPKATRHPWLLPADPAEAGRAAGSGMLDLAVALSPTPDPSPTLSLALDALREAKVPVVRVVFGSRGSIEATAWPGEAARVAVAALEPSAVPPWRGPCWQPSHQGCASPLPATWSPCATRSSRN